MTSNAERLQDRGEHSDECSWPCCLKPTTIIYSAGATPLNKFRVCLCDPHNEAFTTHLRSSHSKQQHNDHDEHH